MEKLLVHVFEKDLIPGLATATGSCREVATRTIATSICLGTVTGYWRSPAPRASSRLPVIVTCPFSRGWRLLATDFALASHSPHHRGPQEIKSPRIERTTNYHEKTIYVNGCFCRLAVQASAVRPGSAILIIIIVYVIGLGGWLFETSETAEPTPFERSRD